MQHSDMLPFLITYVIKNEGNGTPHFSGHFSVSVSKNATEGIFRGSCYYYFPKIHYSPNNRRQEDFSVFFQQFPLNSRVRNFGVRVKSLRTLPTAEPVVILL